jgi:signal transduction histidine kinase
MTNPPYPSSSPQPSSDALDAAMAAHDIRNLLGTVIGHADLQMTAFSGDCSASNAANLHTSLNAIRLSAAHAVTLCDEMLAIADGRPMVLLPVNLSSAAAEAAEIFLARADGAVQVRIEGPEKMYVRGHRLDLQRAMMNLMWNALEAMNGLPHAELILRWGEHEDGAWLEVVDSGPGLPQGHLADLTRPFHGNHSNHDEGSTVRGLGLHSVARLVRRLGGRLLGRNRKNASGAILRIEFGIERELDFSTDLSNARAVENPAASAVDEVLVPKHDYSGD